MCVCVCVCVCVRERDPGHTGQSEILVEVGRGWGLNIKLN